MKTYTSNDFIVEITPHLGKSNTFDIKITKNGLVMKNHGIAEDDIESQVKWMKDGFTKK